jgi:purine-binding chemotaxis protein CheW
MANPQAPHTGSETSPVQRSLVTFQLARQLYALPAESVIQILPMVTIAPLPQSDETLEGIINVRGTTVPVVDMRRHLELAALQPTLRTPIILLKVHQQPVGLIVDEVRDVLTLPSHHVAPTAELLPEELNTFSLLEGLVRIPENIVFVLDPEHLFRPEQIQALMETTQVLLKIASEEKLETLPAASWSQSVIEEVVEKEEDDSGQEDRA